MPSWLFLVGFLIMFFMELLFFFEMSKVICCILPEGKHMTGIKMYQVRYIPRHRYGKEDHGQDDLHK